jgi:flavin reductase (DIM6/NTAB) family NADH-FMN oxidoreductase RutF
VTAQDTAHRLFRTPQPDAAFGRRGRLRGESRNAADTERGDDGNNQGVNFFRTRRHEMAQPPSALPTSEQPAELDAEALRTAYSCFPSGVVAICGEFGGQPVGLVASSFTTVSLDPPLVSFCIQHTSETWPVLLGLPRLGLSVLGATHDIACRQLARKDGDRFAGLSTTVTDQGAVFIDGAAAHLECSVFDELPAGDHRIVLLRIAALSARPTVAPLVFHARTFTSVQTLCA